MSDIENEFGDEEEKLILEGTFVEKDIKDDDEVEQVEEAEVEEEDSSSKKKKSDEYDDKKRKEKKKKSSRKEMKKSKRSSTTKDIEGDIFGDEDEAQEDDGEVIEGEEIPEEGEEDLEYDRKKNRFNEQLNSDDDMRDDEEEEDIKEVISEPIDLVHINTPRVPPVKLMKLKLLNILGIQPKPFDPLTFEEDEDTFEEVGGKQRSNVESVIRWRWGLDDNGRPIKESNTRLVKWSDGSCHLFIGSEVLEVREQELGGDHFYVYSSQDSFIECEGKIDSRMNIRPTDIRSKVHQRLSESIAGRTKKVSKIKSIQTTMDPEKEKELREKVY
eukprot:gene8254-10142_t